MNDRDEVDVAGLVALLRGHLDNPWVATVELEVAQVAALLDHLERDREGDALP